MGMCAGVCGCAQVCTGVRGCAQVCTGVPGVCGYAWVFSGRVRVWERVCGCVGGCTGVRDCARVFIDLHWGTHVCVG